MKSKDPTQAVCVTPDPSIDSGRQQGDEQHVVYGDTNGNMRTKRSEHASADQPPTNTTVGQCTNLEMTSENQIRQASPVTVIWYPYAHCTETSKTTPQGKVGEGQQHSQVPVSEQQCEKASNTGCSPMESCYQYDKDEGSDSVSTGLPSKGDASSKQLQIAQQITSDESQTNQYLDSHKASSDTLHNNSYQAQNQCGYLHSDLSSEQRSVGEETGSQQEGGTQACATGQEAQQTSTDLQVTQTDTST